MPQEVKRWLSADGRYFMSYSEAEAHEKIAMIEDNLKRFIKAHIVFQPDAYHYEALILYHHADIAAISRGAQVDKDTGCVVTP